MIRVAREPRSSCLGGGPGSRRVIPALMLAFLGFLPAVAWAQSGIAGVVKDSTGAVMPGVTVEAASPALIEKVRSAVTDDAGRYNIVDLRPGTYSVTFTLSGFKSVKREGVDLPAAFTATINADLEVGAVEETLTVSGQAPVIDTTNTVHTNVLSKAMLEAMPTDRYLAGYSLLMPGATGGATGYGAGLGNTVTAASIQVHGTRPGEHNILLDGFPTRDMNGGGSVLQYYMDPGTVQEVSVTTGSGPADQQGSGIVSNSIPKEGGNRFSGALFFQGVNESLVAKNLTPELEALGVQGTNSLRKLWDFNPSGGGPIMKDKLWFFLSYRNAGGVADSGGRFNLTPLAWVYTPDLSRPTAATEDIDWNHSVRVTWQASPRNKFAVFWDHQPKIWYNRDVNAITPPEASRIGVYRPQHFGVFTWKSPVSSRFLLEAGTAYNYSEFLTDRNDREQSTRLPASPDLTAISALELSTGVTFRAAASYGCTCSKSYRSRASMSYVTGTHTLKIGTDFAQGYLLATSFRNQDVTYTLRNAAPTQLTQFATTRIQGNVKADLGLYAQDQWALHDLTVNLGLRYDYWNSNIPAQDEPANRWLPARHFDPVKAVVTFHDLAPRLAASYNLFGNGKTALKASVGKYVEVQYPGPASFTGLNNPVTTSVLSANRAWTDRNGDYVPDCDFTIPGITGECGALSDQNFGLNNPRATVYDPRVTHGFGKRGYNWEMATEIQREVVAGLSLNAGYFRRVYGNFLATDNLAVTPADFNPFCINAPVDSRLAGGGGNQICGFYDVSVAKFGQTQNKVSFAKDFQGERSEVYNGVDFTVSARLHGAEFSGGVNTGRSEIKNCQVIDSPQQTLFCDNKPPFQPNIKFLGAYLLPWYGIQVSGVYQNVPGPEISTTTYVVTTSTGIVPTLGRNLSSGAATLIVPIMPRGSMYYNRFTKLDLRFTKLVKIRATRLQASLDIVNALNEANADIVNTRYGTTWLQPQEVQSARVFRFAFRFDF